jgi:hypothetical protein
VLRAQTTNNLKQTEPIPGGYWNVVCLTFSALRMERARLSETSVNITGLDGVTPLKMVLGVFYTITIGVGSGTWNGQFVRNITLYVFGANLA